MNKFKNRIKKLESQTKVNLVIDDYLIEEVAIDVALKVIDIDVLKNISGRYDKVTNKKALKEINKKVNFYKKRLKKHLEVKEVEQVFINKSNKAVLTEEDYDVIINLK